MSVIYSLFQIAKAFQITRFFYLGILSGDNISTYLEIRAKVHGTLTETENN